ncbi:fmHP [Paramyrothecium foliicola]|nr:fmHP [Paramyrothecium foliicola]
MFLVEPPKNDHTGRRSNIAMAASDTAAAPESTTKPAVDVIAEPHHEDLTAEASTKTHQNGSVQQPPTKPTLKTDNGAKTVASKGGQAPESLHIDDSKPEDFEGELATNDELPSPALIKQIENYIVLDKDGRSHTFKSLYSGRNASRRVLVIFIRHFFCGNCQDYLRTLCESISPESLLQLPISTFITVVGCGDPGLIDMYTEATGCSFPIYTDPTRSLFQALGMVKTWTPGPKPAYSKRGLAKGTLNSISQALRNATGGLLLKSGNFAQVGGEFLFEPLQLQTPISTPQDERSRQLGQPNGEKGGLVAQPDGDDDERPVEEKRVTWCHRMRTTRDHVEIPEMMEMLGLGGHGRPSTNEKRWERAPVVHNLLPVDEVVLHGPPIAVLEVLGDAGPDVALPEALAGHLEVDLDEPQLVKQRGGVPPHVPVKGDVVALEHDHAVRRQHADVVLARVLDGVVKGGREDGLPAGRVVVPQGLHEREELGCVEGEGGAAAGVGGGGVGHGGEGGAGEVEAVHGDVGGRRGQ